jgi:hypothetical protein
MHTSFPSTFPRAIRRTTRIDCQVVRLSDFKLVADRIENLSSDGLLVGPADPVLTGEPLLVSFRVPGLRDYVDAEAIVTRVLHGRRPGETRRALGLSWTEITPFSKLLLEAFMKRLPPVPPGRRRETWRSKLTPLAKPLFA